MFSPDDFFELENNKLSGLFVGTEYVWEGLSRIKPFIKSILEPNVSGIICKGVMVQQTVVLHHGELLVSGFSIKLGDATKGELVVERDGAFLQKIDGAVIENELHSVLYFLWIYVFRSFSFQTE